MEENYLEKVLSDNLKQVWFKNKKTKYVIHTGATGSGKTHNAVVRLLECNTGVYLSPLRLLSYEVYEKLSNSVICDLITGEEQIINENSSFSSRTVEMMDYRNHYECVVIDECFMVSDPFRGKAWLKAILETNADEIHIISSLESVTLLKNILTKTHKRFEEFNYKRLTPLEVSNKSYSYKKPLDKTILVTFSRIDVLVQKALFEKRGYNVSVLYGNLPLEAKKEQIEKFVSGEHSICVATDVIGMGLNLPCDHVCFHKIEKFDGTTIRKLNPTEIKQIGGRAGRYGLSEKGTIWGGDNNTKYIKEQLEKPIINNNKAYCEIDFETLKSLPYKTIKDKLIAYKELRFIPKEVSKMVLLEDIKPYLDLCEATFLDDIELELAWNLLILPVGNDKTFWKSLVETVRKKVVLNPIFPKIDYIGDITQLKEAEDVVQDIELYLYFMNRKVFRKFSIDDSDNIKKIRTSLINKITDFLFNKKLSAIKKCESCGDDVGINHVHKLCEDCYYNMHIKV